MRPTRAMIAAFVMSALSTAAAAQATSPPPSPTPDSAAARAAPQALRIRTLRDLVAVCDTPESDPQYPGAIGLCVGYGSGVVDYHLADTAGRGRARKVCLPASTMPTRNEIRRQFVAWARANPQYDEEFAPNAIMRFLIATYPCARR